MQVHILVRHCNVVNNKQRPAWFDKQRVFRNLLNTMDQGCSLHVMLDGNPAGHFVRNYPVSVVHFDGGCDAASFRKTLHFAVMQQERWDPDDIVYFVEDDYLHKAGWPSVLREAFTSNQGDLVSLYDHRDKYKPGVGGCKLTYTDTCHWRTAASTTNTFAVRYATLLDDIELYLPFANPVTSAVCIDHERFLALYRKKKRVLVTSVPGYSTHCESEFLSPVADWEEICLSTGEDRQP